MFTFRQRIFQFDWLLLSVVFVLTAVGLAAIYSVDLSRGGPLSLFPTQVTALLIGLVALLVAGSTHITVYQSSAKIAYIVGFLLLIAVLIFGQSIRGTTGWFRVAGFSFQPVEFAKVSLILFLASWIHRYNRRFRSWQFLVSTGFFTLVYMGLVMLQPDLGSALILGSVWVGLLALAGTKKRYLLGMIGLVALAGTAGWFFLFEDYQKDRLRTFVNPEAYASNEGYNVVQSIIAIGAGRLTGRGLGFGSQSQLHFLPEAQTDFIFSVIGEELGFIGALILLTLYILLLWRLIRIALLCKNDFAAFFVLGVAVMISVQVFINIGGTTGLLPVTGVTLPFVSYGGSSLIMNLLLIGIAQSMAVATNRNSGFEL